MRYVRYASAVLTALFVCATSVVCADPIPDVPHVTVTSCAVGADSRDRPGATIAFRNDGAETITHIVWRARFEHGAFYFSDDAAIAPKESRTRTYSLKKVLLSGTSYYSDNVGDCSLVSAQFERGTRWANGEQVPGKGFVFPTPRPDDATPVPASIENPQHNPIGIIACRVSISRGKTRGLGRKDGSALLGVRFRNLSEKPVDRIVFRARYLSGGVDFIEGGAFSPHTLVHEPAIRHMLGQPVAGHLTRDLPETTAVDYFNSDDDPSNCTTVNAHFVDGTTWQNPDAGPTEPPLPTAPPTLPPSRLSERDAA